MTAITKESAAREAQSSPESRDVDDAWSYFNKQENGGADADSANNKALHRKIDWRIVPLMFTCYTMQFLYKVILNISHDEKAASFSTEQHASMQLSWVYKRNFVLLAKISQILRHSSLSLCFALKYPTTSTQESSLC